MKKIIAVISIFSLVAMFSFGCAPANTTKDKVTRNNVTTDDGTMYNGINKGYDDSTMYNGTKGYGTTTQNGSAYEGYDEKAGTGYNYLTDNNAAGNNGTYRSPTSNNTGMYNNAALGDTNKISSIKNVCNRKDQVDDTSVVINDNTCYVGLDLENNAKLSESMKEDLSSQIKRVDPSITKVYFTEDRSVIDDFADSVKDTVNVDWNRLQNVFR